MRIASPEVSQRHVSVVTAALDEVFNIEEVYERLRRALLALSDTHSEFIWVVEGTDGTAEILKRHARAEDALPFTIVQPRERLGLGAAFRQGSEAVPDDDDIGVYHGCRPEP
jgi:hypothetical protein